MSDEDAVMANIERAVEVGAAALVQGGMVTDRETGDVLYDYDWTPMEAARVVLEAVNHRGAVERAESAEALLAEALAYVDGRPPSPAFDLRQRIRARVGGR